MAGRQTTDKRLSCDVQTPMLSRMHEDDVCEQKKDSKDHKNFLEPPGGASPDDPHKKRPHHNRATKGLAMPKNMARKRKSVVFFERASTRWWNPQFASPVLERQYWRNCFPQLRTRFRYGLVYIMLSCLVWFIFHLSLNDWDSIMIFQIGCLALTGIFLLIFAFTFTRHYVRFYLPTSFIVTFLLCVLSLLFFTVEPPLLSSVGAFISSLEVVLILYTIIPLPLYICVISGITYSILYEVISLQRSVPDPPMVKFLLQICIHILGTHIFIISSVRERKTFLKVGESIMARKDLERERQLKETMINSVMPEKVAEILMNESSELRRPSTAEGMHANQGQVFRVFVMKPMEDVSILFADIAGFTKMSSKTTAAELVDLLNDLFGRFDHLCTESGCEKISTLGDCYYCVSGCPEWRSDHAHCCVEMGLAMVKAIQQFDHDRGQEVNMRVGIHTGSVMCGIVGTHRFKFDVFSNDVTYANVMESTGEAGEVHISEATSTFLNGDYILREGELVEERKTFFVVGPKAGFKEKLGSSTKCLVQNSTSLNGSATPAATGRLAIGIPLSDPEDSGSPLPSSRENTPHGGASPQGGPLWARHSDIRHIDSSELETEQALHDSSKAGATSSSQKTSGRHGPSANMITSRSGSLRTKLLAGQLNTAVPRSPREEPTKSFSVGALVDKGGERGSPSGQHGAGKKISNLSNHEPGTNYSNNRRLLGGSDHRIDVRVLPSSDANSDAGGERDPELNDTQADRHSTSDSIRKTLAMESVISITRPADELTDQKLAASLATVDHPLLMHAGTFNPLTLTFQPQKKLKPEGQPESFMSVESLYREHFGGRTERFGTRVVAPKYSVAVDILVAASFYFLSAVVASVVFGARSVAWLVCFTLLTLALVIFLAYFLWHVWKRHDLPNFMNQWYSRHLVAILLIEIALSAGLSNVDCSGDSHSSTQLVALYIMYTVLLAHCNFSQLAHWVKTLLASIIGLILITMPLAFHCPCHIKGSGRNVTIPPRLSLSHLNPIMSKVVPTPPASGNATAGVEDESQRVRMVSPAELEFFRGPCLYQYEVVIDVLLALILIGFLNRQFESIFRMSFFGDMQAVKDIDERQKMKEQADWLLSNIIPDFILEKLKATSRYSENHEDVAVLFASIVNWGAVYEESYKGGREFLRVLNEIVGDFDDLLERPEFDQVEKIKTIGSCYMAASGLNSQKRKASKDPETHLKQLLEFGLALQETLDNFNQNMLGFDFVMKLGYNIGPVTAGVIGTTKLYYDIWGDTVNISSRMYSTGVKGRIQVSDRVKERLEPYFNFDFRDHIDVKGIDGGMDVYLVKEKKS